MNVPTPEEVTAAGVDALALVTLARSGVSDAELLLLALDHLKSRPGEQLGDMLAREARLIAVLATFAAGLVESLDDMHDGAGEKTLRTLGLTWAERLTDEEEK
jgi:hypothetical protein